MLAAKMISKHEVETIRSFIVRRKRERYLEFVSNPKTRAKLTHQLAHFKDIDPACKRSIIPSLQNPRGIAKLLIARGAPGYCYLISEDPRLDGRELQLSEALDEIVGSGMGAILSCVAGRLAFIETEDERFILEKQKKQLRPRQRIRFVATVIDHDSGARQGIFQVAYRLRDDWDVPEHHRMELRDLLGWFNDHLPVPELLSEPRHKSALSWFKPESKASITRVWSIVRILQQNGVVINKIRTGNPGLVIYEDEWQIVAKPWNEV